MLSEPLPPLPGSHDPTPVGVLSRLFSMAHTAGLLGFEAEAKEIYPLVAERAGRFPVMFFESIVSERIVGMLASTLGLWDEAERHYVEAARIAAEFPNRFDKPFIDFRHGKMLLDQGRPEDRDRALTMIESARAEFERRGMPNDAKAASELLAR